MGCLWRVIGILARRGTEVRSVSSVTTRGRPMIVPWINRYRIEPYKKPICVDSAISMQKK